MSKKWHTSAQAYRAQESERQKKERAQIRKESEERALREAASLQQQTDINRATVELEHFMSTEGAAAMELLRASNRHINFAEAYDGGGSGTVYFIDGDGLKLSVEPMGSWVAYRNGVPKPKITHVRAREVVEATVRCGGKKATEIVDWLRSELDKIADAAPVTT